MSIYAARADLKDDVLAGLGFTVHDHVPDSIEDPCIVIEPGDNYVIPGDLFDRDDIDVRFFVWLFVPITGDNERNTNALDNMLAQVIPALTHSDYILTGTTQPGPQTNGGWLAHGVRLSVETTTTL